jgi:hypothetical protein
LLAVSLNEQLDSNVIMSQQLDEKIARSIKFDQFDTYTTATLPAAADRADKIIKFDVDGELGVASAADFFGNAVLGANYVTNTATGTGSQVAFGLTVSPGSKNNIQVYIDGVYQNKASFSISAATITFSEAPPLNSAIEFIIGQAVTEISGDSDSIDYTQGGTGSQQRTLTSKLQETVSVKDFGAVGDGVVDDSAAFIAAILAVQTAGGGTVKIPNRGPYKINSQITIPNGVVLDGNYSQIRCSNNIDLIVINAGGSLRNADIYLVSQPSYSSVAITLLPTGNTQGDRFVHWAENVIVQFAANGVGTGTGFKLDASEYYIQLTRAYNLSVRYGEKGIWMTGGDEPLEYCNGNVIDTIVLMDPTYSFYIEGASNGNSFDNIVIEANTGSTVYCEGGRNVFSGIAWDQVPIIVSGDGNKFDVQQTTPYGVDITDTGEDNVATAAGSIYTSGISTNNLNDWRNNVYAPGKIEFHDMMLGGYDPRWTETTSGTGAIAFGSANFGNTTALQFSPYIQLSANNSGTAVLDFNGNGFVKLTQKPVVHFTNFTTNTDGRLVWKTGLYTDANNYILAIQDFGTYADDDIRLVVSNAGTSTTQSISTAAFNRITFATMIMSPTSVELRVGQYNQGTGGSDSYVSRGTIAIQQPTNYGGGGSATVTSNIPTSSALEPYIYMEGPHATNTGYIQFLDWQLVASRQARIN